MLDLASATSGGEKHKLLASIASGGEAVLATDSGGIASRSYMADVRSPSQAQRQGGEMSEITREELDAKLEASEARTEARFAEIRGDFRAISEQLAGLHSAVEHKPSVTWIIGVAVAGFLGVVAVLAFGGDRFDGGVQVQSTISQQALEAQRLATENSEQIQRVLSALEEATRSNANPQASKEAQGAD